MQKPHFPLIVNKILHKDLIHSEACISAMSVFNAHSRRKRRSDTLAWAVVSSAAAPASAMVAPMATARRTAAFLEFGIARLSSVIFSY
jgi:hypothetical protein